MLLNFDSIWSLKNTDRQEPLDFSDEVVFCRLPRRHVMLELIGRRYWRSDFCAKFQMLAFVKNVACHIVSSNSSQTTPVPPPPPQKKKQYRLRLVLSVHLCFLILPYRCNSLKKLFQIRSKYTKRTMLVLLRWYSFYSQATDGTLHGKRGLFNI